jgi:hypothetical protein
MVYDGHKDYAMCDLYEALKTMISVVANLQPMTFSAIEVDNFIHLAIHHVLAAPNRTFKNVRC